MKIEKQMKASFSVIGKEGSTLDGQGFIQKLWEDANSHFSEVQALAKKDEYILYHFVQCFHQHSDTPSLQE